MATGQRKRWSKHVTDKGNALDLEEVVFDVEARIARRRVLNDQKIEIG